MQLSRRIVSAALRRFLFRKMAGYKGKWKAGQRPGKIHLRLLPFGPDRVRRDSARADFPRALYIP